MSFSLQAVDAAGGERDEFLSLSNRTMEALREVVARDADLERSALLSRLRFNDGGLVEPAECQWLAAQLRAVDRDRLARAYVEADEPPALVDQFAAFCDRSATLGGFEVW